ncbi:MAG: 30S ribosomal protein S15 [Planctomycetota bacterium]|nr:MAG: 30S ribosomal protein S15 [Planctomycetota bacterium]
MSVSREKKQSLIQDFGQSQGDTGSVEIQVAILTTRIANLTDHLRVHKKDVSTRRGLLKLVARRAKLLKYLKRTENQRYVALIQRLGLRG